MLNNLIKDIYEELIMKSNRILFVKQDKKIILVADIFSFAFGFLGIIFGILSLLALATFWNKNSEIRELHSFIFTIVTIIFDSLSVLSAMLAYSYGKKFYNNQNKLKIKKPKKSKEYLISESYSLCFDFWSFVFGIAGLIFGIVSLVTLYAKYLDEKVSSIATIISVCLDTVSCVSVVFAMIYFLKCERLNKKNIR